ncbi:MAG: hypothetical protein GY913_00505 [Proteobacteria bacterium]|nr:hypothetical protein [Pseudomonadota bacterium]MCP4915378.1 hypothetical protein [Pseudomonadota bacterium]
MAPHEWRHRSERRHALTGTVRLRQGGLVGLLSLVDASAFGLCLQGPVDGVDPRRSVQLTLTLGGEEIELVGWFRWRRSTAVTTLHGWSLSEVPEHFGDLLGATEENVPIALPDEDIEVDHSVDHDSRFGRLLGTG